MGKFKREPKEATTEPSVDDLSHEGMKRGGKAHKKNMAMGGNPMMRSPLARPMMRPGMRPGMRAGVAPSVAMPPAALMRKKGGEVESAATHKAEMHEMRKIEKELKHHESEKAGKAHHGLKAGGRAMDSFETKTTIEGNEGKYTKSKMMDGEHHDKHSGTGSIKEGKPAGFKRGGKAMCKATGGSIPSGTDNKPNKGRSEMGGTIEDNEGDYERTEMHGAKRDRASGTKGIKETNAGGYKKGGMISRTGLSSASIEHDGDWENRAANGTPKGKENMKTGLVREANAGGYKKGGSLKKHYATGGSVNDEGKATPMAHHFISEPVSNSRQSGTFKKGGHIKKFADGGMMEEKEPKKSETSAMRKLLGMGSPMARKKGGSTNC